MRSTLLFAAFATLLFSIDAWNIPKWNEVKEQARQHMDKMKNKLPSNVKDMMQKAEHKFDEHQAKKDINNAMSNMEKNLMSKLQNQAAGMGLKVHNMEALNALMKHMMLNQAEHNMKMSSMMDAYAHRFAGQIMGTKHTSSNIKSFGVALSTLGHKYMGKLMDGTGAILKKNGVHLKSEQLQQALQHSSYMAMKGNSMMGAVMSELNKLGVNAAGLDSNLKNEMEAHFEKLKTEGTAELQKILNVHKIPLKVEQVVALMKSKGPEMLGKMKNMQQQLSKNSMEKMLKLVTDSFKNMKPGDHKKLLMRFKIMIHPAMNSNFHLIARIFKKHKIEGNHMEIHTTLYHRMKDEVEDHHYRHHHWWHKKSVKLAFIIGGSIFGAAFLVSLIIVIVHMVKEKRRTPPRSEIYGEEKKSPLPYSIMNEKMSVDA